MAAYSGPRRFSRIAWRQARVIGAVNMLADTRRRLTIEVVHDLVCPWCFLGARRLRRAIRRRPDLAVDLVWRPFLLNPDMPAAGLARGDYLLRKFGSEERGRRLYASVTELGAAEGVPFRFDRIGRVPSSVDAHRLVRICGRIAPASAADIVDALFVAHFRDGRDIGDLTVLAAIAAEQGLDAAPIRRALGSAEELDLVHGENLRSHRLGINGVPCIILAERTAIAGAQEAEVIERLLDVAALEGMLVG